MSSGFVRAVGHFGRGPANYVDLGPPTALARNAVTRQNTKAQPPTIVSSHTG